MEIPAAKEICQKRDILRAGRDDLRFGKMAHPRDNEVSGLEASNHKRRQHPDINDEVSAVC